MIRRRAVLLGGAGVLCAGMAPELPVPAGDRLTFRIIRKGSDIGRHVIEFSPDGDALTVNIAVDIAVGIGPIVLFRYTHRATEHWRGQALVSMNTETNEDGTRTHLTLQRVGSGLVVQSSKFPTYVAPGNALPGSHWNEKMLDGPIINTEHGKLLRPQVTALKEEAVPVASGGTIEARHFAVRGDANLDTWYDDTPTWVGLRFVAHEGSEIRLERM
jgi:hypothetical protein